MSKTFHVGQVVSLDFVRRTKHTASLREPLVLLLGRVLVLQRRVIKRQKQIENLISHVESDIPLRMLVHGVPINMDDLAAKTGKSKYCIWRKGLEKDLYDAIVRQQKVSMWRANLRECIRMAAKGKFEKVVEILEGANAASSNGAAWQAWAARRARGRDIARVTAGEVEVYLSLFQKEFIELTTWIEVIEKEIENRERDDDAAMRL
jgi:hypothetical protein